jgi:energy-coupling factor transporter ATP-binding protein EcfA2
MDELSIKLKNCYGINTFEHNFSFAKCNANLIYAPNGVMKTSLAKTFQRLAEKKEPEEKLYNRQPEYEIKLDGEDITADDILVVQPFDPGYESGNISTLLVNFEQKAQYDAAYKEVLDARQGLLTKLNKLSKIKKEEIETQLAKDFSCDNIFDALEVLKGFAGGNDDYAKIPYAKLFDDKVLGLLNEQAVSDSIQDYTARYSELLEQSSLYKKGKFNPGNASTVSKSLKKECFFDAEHKLLLNGKAEPVSNQADFDALFEQESDAILGDGALKAISQKIIGGVAPIKAFQVLLEQTPQLAADLSDLDNLRKVLWASYYLNEKEGFDGLLESFTQHRDELTAIEEQAQLEDTLWHEAQGIFKDRFHVPFGVDIEDHTNAILGTTAPNMVFTFEGDGGEPIRFDRGQLDSLNCLSVGERRAMYLLYVIFEFKARLKAGRKTVIIIDDIADSFDYKNKYAIIEYLKELADEGLLRLVVLTHNFDFYRTFQSRVLDTAKWDNSFVAQRNAGAVILLKGGSKDVASPFELWKNSFPNNSAMLVSMIPFVRNLIEYKDGSVSETCKQLTSLLHIKPDTRDFKLVDLEVAIAEVIKAKPLGDQFNRDELVIDHIYSTASKLAAEDHGDTISLENKVALSIAIRLKAEEFMWQHVTDDSEIRVNQTSKLFDRLCRENAGLDNGFGPVRKVLSQVSLMTPENIHLNSFMYEPLMDMSIHHLVGLFNEVAVLSWAEKELAEA